MNLESRDACQNWVRESVSCETSVAKSYVNVAKGSESPCPCGCEGLGFGLGLRLGL